MDSTLARRLTTRWRHYVWSVGTGLVAAAFVVTTALDPATLTSTTQEAARTTADAFYPSLAWPRAAGLVALLYHGPYVTGLLGSILGFGVASAFLYGWTTWSVTHTENFDHDAPLATVEAVVVAVGSHGVALAAAAYVPAVAWFATDGGLVNPFGAWAALGPALVVGFTVAGGLAAATVGAVEDGVGSGAVAVVGLLLPVAGLQYAHAAPARHPKVGLLGSALALVAFGAVCRTVLRRRTR